ncbi:MAG: caspase family protein [bacterium]|nr:MAG: caspase family protein [bacterium]
MKKAICVGINKYPGLGDDLKGCVNDANDWANLLQLNGFETKVILDGHATRNNLLSELENLITAARSEDVIVFTYSGHGTNVLDTSGDESDEYDEALYVYDGIILDDELRKVIQKVKVGVHLIVISDSCFSGTVTRIASAGNPRYVKTDEIPANAKLKKRLLSEEDMVEILLSGCDEDEYSYDDYINGRWNGVFSANAIKIIRDRLTYNEFHEAVCKILPSDQYPQSPQLEGSTENKNRLLFETDSLIPLPEQEPDPEPEKSWFSKYWWIIGIIILVCAIIYWVLK